jgi:large conductance mechanosensitive channel
VLGEVPANLQGSTDYAALKKAGMPLLGYGEFVTQAVNFLFIAFIIFLLIRALNKVIAKPEEAPAADPADVVLLREIRDELRRKNGGA